MSDQGWFHFMATMFVVAMAVVGLAGDPGVSRSILTVGFLICSSMWLVAGAIVRCLNRQGNR